MQPRCGSSAAAVAWLRRRCVSAVAAAPRWPCCGARDVAELVRWPCRRCTDAVAVSWCQRRTCSGVLSAGRSWHHWLHRHGRCAKRPRRGDTGVVVVICVQGTGRSVVLAAPRRGCHGRSEVVASPWWPRSGITSSCGRSSRPSCSTRPPRVSCGQCCLLSSRSVISEL